MMSDAMEKRKKKFMKSKDSPGARASFLLSPDTNFVLIGRKVRLARYMSRSAPAQWSRSASPPGLEVLRTNQLQDLCADLLSVPDLDSDHGSMRNLSLSLSVQLPQEIKKN